MVEIVPLHGMMALKFTVPVKQHDEIEGVCVVYVTIDRNDVERYARLGQTRVNIFIGSTLRVGTLSDYSAVPDEVLHTMPPVDPLRMPARLPIEFSQMAIAKQPYYQGHACLRAMTVSPLAL